jgi:hypothetical protein
MMTGEFLSHGALQEMAAYGCLLAVCAYGCRWVIQRMRRRDESSGAPLDARRLEHLLGARACRLPAQVHRTPARRTLDSERLELRLRGIS